MKNKSLGLNAVLNGARSIINMLVPLITLPYITRILGAENLGKYNFANSIVGYFSLLAGLGISTYSIREGAKYKKDDIRISQFASEVFTINIISTFISYICLFLLTLFTSKINNYSGLIFIISINILLTTVGCDWVFSIYEEYLYITIRGILIQILYVVFLFIFVRNQDDLVKYAWVSIISSSGAYLINVFELKKYCNIKIVKNFNVKMHLPAILIIFANTITVSLYTNSDITILGLLKSDYEVGIYTVTVKIYNMIKQLLAAIIVVAIPRLSLYWGLGEKDKFENTANKIANTLFSIVCPIMIGIFSLSSDIVMLVGGQDFLDATLSLKIISIALLFSAFSWFFTDCVLIPCKLEKKVLYISIISATINIVLNLILIPYGKQNAAAFTTLLAEFISMIMCSKYVRKIIKIHIKKIDIVSNVIGCIFIYVICKILKSSIHVFVVYIFGSIAISMIGYILIQIVIGNSIYKKMFYEVLIRIKKH